MDFDPTTLIPRQDSQMVIRYDLPEGVADVIDVDSAGRPTVRPQYATLLLTPDTEGSWCLDLFTVFGHQVIDGKVKERKRLRSVLYSDPMDRVDMVAPEDHMPTELLALARHVVSAINGWEG